MPWHPLPRIAFAVAIYPFQPSSPADLPLEIGDELYIIERGGVNGSWYRGYLVAPPSLLSGLTSVNGRTLEARVFSGIFPKNCVEVREYLGEVDGQRTGSSPSPIPVVTNGKVNIEPGPSPSPSTSTVDKNSLEANGVAKPTKNISQITVIKLERDGARSASGSSSSMKSPSGLLTPTSDAPKKDPNAPKPPAPVPMLKIGDETPTSSSEPLVDEIASCLREWHSTNIHELLLTRQYAKLDSMSNLVLELDLSRRQLLHNVLTGQERSALREETVWKLVRGNKMLSGEVIVRDPNQSGRLLTGDDSPVQVTKLQSEMSLLEGPQSSHVDTITLHHLLVEVSEVSGMNTGSVKLAVGLYLKPAGGEIKKLSETYSMDIPAAGDFSAASQSVRLKSLFTNLSSADIGEGSGSDSRLLFVMKVLASEPPKISLQPPSSRVSSSHDGQLSGKGTGPLNSAGKGSVKGRRSIMWNPKSRGGQHADGGSQNSRLPAPRSSDSSVDGEKRPDRPVKEIHVTRVIGIGVLEVGLVLRDEKDVEQMINIWSPLRENDEEDDHSDGFDDIIRSLLYSPTGRYTRCYRASRLRIHLHPFTGNDTGLLVRNNPTSLQDVAHTQRIGFPGAPTKPRSDIYLKLSRATIPQDALLSHPVHGQVAVPPILPLRNLQLTLEVRSSTGARVEHCIFPTSTSHGLTAWRTTAAERGSFWNETIRLNIPADQVSGCHLVMSLADAPEFPFALSWMPLWDQQAFIRDGPHSLLLHAYDKSTSSIENGKGAYLALPWSSLGKNESTKDEALTGPLATLLIETDLCSTELSQDQILLGLINWKERSPSELLELLRRVVFVPEIEIVKQLRAVFDSLFGIMVEHAGNEEYEDLVFNDLVTVLGIVYDRRFNLEPLVDYYAEKQFNFPFATPYLIKSYSRLLQASADPLQSRNLRAAFKVGRHLLKFIVNAREQQKAKEEGIGITKIQSTFNRDLHTIFKSVETLMRNPAPILVGNKTLVVQHFHTWLPELSNALSKDEIIGIALSFMDACEDVKSMLILYKLVLILNYLKLPLFDAPDDWKKLMLSCLRWIAPYWGPISGVSDQYRDQVRLCSSIVAELLVKYPEPEIYECMPKATASYCAIVADGVDETEWLSLLFSKSFPFQLKKCESKHKFDEALVELAAVIAGLSKLPSPKRLSLKRDELSMFLSQAFEAHKSVLSCEAYPATWLSLHIYQHRAIMRNLEYLSSILIENFVPSPDEAERFDLELWRQFFTTLLSLVSSDAVALEKFPEQKRRTVWKIAGDVREHGANLLRKSWEAIGWDTSAEERSRYGLTKLGGYQVQYVPSLVPPIIELCLSVHEGLRRVAVEILKAMVIGEWQLNEDLGMLEAEIISSLDSLFKMKKDLSENASQKMFINELLALFEKKDALPSPELDSELTVAAKELVATIDELLDLLAASHNGDITESLNTLKLMEFMKDMDKEDIFIRYVRELARSQVATKNYTEAGLALQFHADLYDWDTSKPVGALSDPSFCEQSSFERKEALYFQIIQHFEDGKAWAHALSCYKELADYYEHTILDFPKLARTQASIARIYDAIVKEQKLFPRYFCVTFMGLGFPQTLKDKKYIFEGSPTDRMATFTDRMQKRYPAAQIVTSMENSDVEGQYIHITPVGAHKDITHPVYQRSKLPHSVRDHLLISTPSQFSVTSKRNVAGTNVVEQWLAKTVYVTAEPFPNVLRRSEIVDTTEVVLTPLQTAIDRAWRKTHELLLLEKRAASGDDASLNGLTEALGKLLDAESKSSTSVALYRQFLESDERRDSPISGEASNEKAEEQEQACPVEPVDPQKTALAAAMIDHVLAMKRCLSLYSRPAFQATQAELTKRFEMTFAPEIATLDPSKAAQAKSTDELSRSSMSNGNSGRSPDLDSHNLAPGAISAIVGPLKSRSMSPEEELIRSSRRESGTPQQPNEKGTSGSRLGLGLRKRHNHTASSSIATIKTATVTSGGADHDRADDAPKPAKSAGAKIDDVLEDRRTMTPPPSRRADADDATRTSHTRTPSVSKSTRSGKSETIRKRRSFFGGRRGGGGDVVSASSAAHNGTDPIPLIPSSKSTENVRTTRQRITDRAKAVQVQEKQNGSSVGNTSAKKQSQPVSPQFAGPLTSSARSATPERTAKVQQIANRPSRDGGSGKVIGSGVPGANPSSTSGTGGVRDSVMKRFSLLKVGRKSSRTNVRGVVNSKFTGAGALREE